MDEEYYSCVPGICWDYCNRCGRWRACSVKDEDCWPAADGNYYGCLCTDCKSELSAAVAGKKKGG